MSTKAVCHIIYESLVTFTSKESSAGFFFFNVRSDFFCLYNLSFAELRPLDFGIRTICQSNVFVSELVSRYELPWFHSSGRKNINNTFTNK